MSVRCRAFPVAAAKASNSLPQSVQNASSIIAFRRELESFCLGVTVLFMRVLSISNCNDAL